jgi:hypothetical protein
MMHSMTARVLRVLGGLWLVLYAFMLAILGTAIAVTGIADICPMELVVNATGAKRSGPHRRAA